MKIPKISWGFAPKLHQDSVLDPLGAHSAPQNLQLIIAIAAQSFSENSKKTRPANFSLFRPLYN